ncbi:MAG TPA: hypothetical protein VIM56_13035 [Rhizomicrobium sp.]
MSTADIAAWQVFFSVVAQVGATLAGLLFVGLTISLQHVLAARGYLTRAFASLFLQFEILLIGIFGLIPNQPSFALGIELIIGGVAVFGAIFLFSRNFPEDENSTVLSSRLPRTARPFMTATGTLLPAISGVCLIVGWRGSLYLLIPAIVACIYRAIGYAWVFAVEIPRRAEEKRK